METETAEKRADTKYNLIRKKALAEVRVFFRIGVFFVIQGTSLSSSTDTQVEQAFYLVPRAARDFRSLHVAFSSCGRLSLD